MCNELITRRSEDFKKTSRLILESILRHIFSASKYKGAFCSNKLNFFQAECTSKDLKRPTVCSAGL